MSIRIIRPTMTMVDNILCRVYEYESWIFNDCAIVQNRDRTFTALLMVQIDDGYLYYGFIPKLHPYAGLYSTREKLDTACENFEDLWDARIELVNRATEYAERMYAVTKKEVEE